MHVLHQNGIALTIQKYPLMIIETYTARKNKIKLHIIILYFAYCHCKKLYTYLLPL